jgi:hypothetical protein
VPAPAPAPQFVFIKRAGGAAADGEVYAKLAILPGDDVADLAARACAKFGWGSPSQARLYLVVQSEVGGEAPSADDEKEALAGDALFPAASLQRARIEPGALLLARVPPPAAPAAAEAAAAAAAAGASFLAQPPPPHLVWPRFHAHASVGACSISPRAAHSALARILSSRAGGGGSELAAVLSALQTISQQGACTPALCLVPRGISTCCRWNFTIHLFMEQWCNGNFCFRFGCRNVYSKGCSDKCCWR